MSHTHIDPDALETIIQAVEREYFPLFRARVWPWRTRRERELSDTLQVLHRIWLQVHGEALGELLDRRRRPGGR